MENEFQSIASEMENYPEEISVKNDNTSITSFREGNYYSGEKIVVRFTPLPLEKGV